MPLRKCVSRRVMYVCMNINGKRTSQSEMRVWRTCILDASRSKEWTNEQTNAHTSAYCARFNSSKTHLQMCRLSAYTVRSSHTHTRTQSEWASERERSRKHQMSNAHNQKSKQSNYLFCKPFRCDQIRESFWGFFHSCEFHASEEKTARDERANRKINIYRCIKMKINSIGVKHGRNV